MKRILFVLALQVSFGAICVAQQVALNLDDHSPSIGDSVLFVEVPYQPLSIQKGGDCIWDFSKIITDSIVQHSYYYASGDDTTQFTQHFLHSHHRYQQCQDTLWYIGFENANISVSYASKRKAMVFPFAFGDSIVGDFGGVGRYSHKKNYSIVGKNRVCAEAWGKLILPEYTVDTTLLVHHTNTYISGLKDSTSVVEEILQWYGINYCYPLLEISQTYTSEQPDSLFIVRAFYHIPTDDDFQQMADDSIIRTTDTIINIEDSVLINISLFPNPVHNNLTIQYNQKRQAEVSYSIYYDGGLCVYKSPKRLQEIGVYSENISMSAMAIGAYVVYIHVDDKQVAFNIIKY